MLYAVANTVAIVSVDRRASQAYYVLHISTYILSLWKLSYGKTFPFTDVSQSKCDRVNRFDTVLFFFSLFPHNLHSALHFLSPSHWKGRFFSCHSAGRGGGPHLQRTTIFTKNKEEGRRKQRSSHKNGHSKNKQPSPRASVTQKQTSVT